MAALDSLVLCKFASFSISDSLRAAGSKRAEFENALDEYYDIRGWDENGVPTGEKRRELGLL